VAYFKVLQAEYGNEATGSLKGWRYTNLKRLEIY